MPVGFLGRGGGGRHLEGGKQKETGKKRLSAVITEEVSFEERETTKTRRWEGEKIETARGRGGVGRGEQNRFSLPRLCVIQ